jgi:hypothetical protein
VLKLAECGVDRIGVHYLKNRTAAEKTASRVRERGAGALLLQADVTKPDDIPLRLYGRALVASISLSPDHLRAWRTDRNVALLGCDGFSEGGPGGALP